MKGISYRKYLDRETGDDAEIPILSDEYHTDVPDPNGN
jgi:hypothetical protein